MKSIIAAALLFTATSFAAETCPSGGTLESATILNSTASLNTTIGDNGTTYGRVIVYSSIGGWMYFDLDSRLSEQMYATLVKATELKLSTTVNRCSTPDNNVGGAKKIYRVSIAR
ncbi:MAG: hypothetical protein IPK50_00840 [Fibrobacterota bacterium]|nr:MAG: hypothetical protein IPK50_00840 [Fibrobacterota bacterium]